MKIVALTTILLSGILGHKVYRDTDLQREVEALRHEGKLFQDERNFPDISSIEAYEISVCKDAIKLMKETSGNIKKNLRRQHDDDQDEIRNYLAVLEYKRSDCASKNI